MKPKTLLFALLLPFTMAAQTMSVLDVSSLSDEDSHDKVAIVYDRKLATAEGQKIIQELRKQQSHVEGNRGQQDLQRAVSEAPINELQAGFEEMYRNGYITEAEYKKQMAQFAKMGPEIEKAQKQLGKMASTPGASDPGRLKEQIRSYAFGNRFFYKASYTSQNFILVSEIGGDGKEYQGFINIAQGRMVIEPNKYLEFNRCLPAGAPYFTLKGYAIGHTEDGAELIDNTGKVILTGYRNLKFDTYGPILQAQNHERKWGIIDYSGKVLEPFIHNTDAACGLEGGNAMWNACERLVKQFGGPKPILPSTTN